MRPGALSLAAAFLVLSTAAILWYFLGAKPSGSARAGLPSDLPVPAEFLGEAASPPLPSAPPAPVEEDVSFAPDVPAEGEVSAGLGPVDEAAVPVESPSPLEAPPAPPPPPLEAPAASSPRNYVVRRGDNLWSVSRRFYGRGSAWVRLWRANERKVPDFDRLPVGLALSIPDDR